MDPVVLIVLLENLNNPCYNIIKSLINKCLTEG